MSLFVCFRSTNNNQHRLSNAKRNACARRPNLSQDIPRHSLHNTHITRTGKSVSCVCVLEQPLRAPYSHSTVKPCHNSTLLYLFVIGYDFATRCEGGEELEGLGRLTCFVVIFFFALAEQVECVPMSSENGGWTLSIAKRGNFEGSGDFMECRL